MATNRLRPMLGIALSCALLIAACGGGDDEVAAEGSTTTAQNQPAATTAAPTSQAPPSSESPATTTAAPSESVGSSGAANQVAVTIDGELYEFDVELSIVGRCDPDFFGAFWVIANAADGSGGSVEMFIVPEGNTNHDETSRVGVNLKDLEGRDWHADEDGGGGVAAGESRVESATIEGNTVSGTASLVDIYAGDGATARGTFEATCP